MDEKTIAEIYRYAGAACKRYRLPADCVPDVAQEAIVQVLREAQNYDPTRSPKYAGDAGYQRFLTTRGSYAAKVAAEKESRYRNKNRSYDDTR